jgi:8-oxo-dGTP pyrophosphatase MutT (NUDIX family)
MPEPNDDLVRAAGAVLVRDGLVAVVHRPRYDDWSLPKGKLEAGEDDEQAAHREVLEETGFHAAIEADLGTTSYTVERGGAIRPKVVRYYLMRAVDGGFDALHEVDRLEWLPPADAAARMTYDRDRELLLRVADRIPTQNANFGVAGGEGTA